MNNASSMDEIMTIASTYTWRASKGIYRFAPEIYTALVSQPMSGDIPWESLYHLPGRGRQLWAAAEQSVVLNGHEGIAIGRGVRLGGTVGMAVDIGDGAAGKGITGDVGDRVRNVHCIGRDA